jgi:hypothetical protein
MNATARTPEPRLSCRVAAQRAAVIVHVSAAVRTSGVWAFRAGLKTRPDADHRGDLAITGSQST